MKSLTVSMSFAVLTTSAITATLLGPQPVSAEISPDAYQNLKANASEVLRIIVRKVQVVDEEAWQINYRIEALVHSVERSAAGYRPGSIITFGSYCENRASIQSGRTGPRSPPQLRAGWSGRVYLGAEFPPVPVQGLLGPAAYGQSFERFHLDPPATASSTVAPSPSSRTTTPPIRAGKMAIVTEASATIMDADKVLGSVAIGTRFWIFSVNNSWAEIKLPDSEQHGWMAVASLQPLTPTSQGQQVLAEATNLLERSSQYKRDNNLSEAQACLIRRFTLLADVLGYPHPDLADALETLGGECPSPEDARVCFEKALTIDRVVFGTNHYRTAKRLDDFSHFENNQKNYSRALTLAEECIEIRKKLVKPTDPLIGSALFEVAFAASGLHDKPRAIRLYNEVLAIERVNGNDRSTIAGNALYNLGRIDESANDFAAAEQHYEQALAIYRRTYGPHDQYTKDAETKLQQVRHGKPKSPEASDDADTGRTKSVSATTANVSSAPNSNAAPKSTPSPRAADTSHQPLTEDRFRALFLGQDDLPKGFTVAGDQRITAPDPNDRMFKELQGVRGGFMRWTPNPFLQRANLDPKNPVTSITDIRLEFPSEQAARAYIDRSLQYLSEGAERCLNAGPVGDDCHVFGPTNPSVNAKAIFGFELYGFTYVFREGRFVSKVNVMLVPNPDGKANPEVARRLAKTAHERLLAAIRP